MQVYRDQRSQTRVLKPQTFILPHPGDRTSDVKVSHSCAPSGGSRGGSFLPLPASGGSRRPWAWGRLPPVSASVFPGLLLCVCVSPLLCLIRTLSLDVGPPSSRRTSSQTLHFITSAETLLPQQVPFPGSRHQNPIPLRTIVQAVTALPFLGVPVLGMCS